MIKKRKTHVWCLVWNFTAMFDSHVLILVIPFHVLSPLSPHEIPINIPLNPHEIAIKSQWLGQSCTSLRKYARPFSPKRAFAERQGGWWVTRATTGSTDGLYLSTATYEYSINIYISIYIYTHTSNYMCIIIYIYISCVILHIYVISHSNCWQVPCSWPSQCCRGWWSSHRRSLCQTQEPRAVTYLWH